MVGLLVLSTPPPPAHKNLWCHYPPGGWTTNPATSHVLLLDIDVAADSNKGITAHLIHSPSLPGQTCNPASFNGTTPSGCAEGVATDGTAASCPGQSACTLPETP